MPNLDPYAGHACNHCYLCDVVGICCATVSATQRAQLEALRPDLLHEAIKQDADVAPSLRVLVRRDAEHRLTKPAIGRPAMGLEPRS